MELSRQSQRKIRKSYPRHQYYHIIRRSCGNSTLFFGVFGTLLLFLLNNGDFSSTRRIVAFAFSSPNFGPPARISSISSMPTKNMRGIMDQRKKIESSDTSLYALPKFVSSSKNVAAMATPMVRTAPLAPLAALLKSIASVAEIICGGLISGTLHAIAGPDHLAALIPRCCGLTWHKAARVGAIWGLGHGVSATLLGVCGFLFKKGARLTGLNKFLGLSGMEGNFNLLHHAGSFMELAIGISLVIIGLLGIKEAREWEIPKETQCDVLEDGVSGPNSEGTPQSLSSAATPTSANKSSAKSAILLNGLLHGLSWDGAPSLAPAVAISSLGGSLTFLLSYAFGTMAAMTVSTALIGEGTKRAIEKAMKNGKGKGSGTEGDMGYSTLPRDLSVGSSFLAVVVGIVWCWLALR